MPRKDISRLLRRAMTMGGTGKLDAGLCNKPHVFARVLLGWRLLSRCGCPRCLLFISLVFLLTLNFLACGRGGMFENKKEVAIADIGRIADGLNAYFDKFGQYPEDINALKDYGFLSRFPFNPYRKGNSEMMAVRVSTPVPGDFSYLKIYRDRFSDEIMYYVLILWGPQGTKSPDVLDAAYNYDDTHLTEWIDMPDGKTDAYLTIIKSELRLKPEGGTEE